MKTYINHSKRTFRLHDSSGLFLESCPLCQGSPCIHQEDQQLLSGDQKSCCPIVRRVTRRVQQGCTGRVKENRKQIKCLVNVPPNETRSNELSRYPREYPGGSLQASYYCFLNLRQKETNRT